jgi:DNA-damage-inducible protein J
MATKNISVRIDEELKQQIETLLDSFGLNLTTAIHLYIHKVLSEQRIPFEIGHAHPNRMTHQAILEAKKYGKQKAKSYKSSDELKARLIK